MRTAILSDVHGNSVALDAVLSDIATQGGVDGYWLLGDLVAMGPDPAGVVQRLRKLPNSVAVRGNTDRWLTDIHKEFPLSPLAISQAIQNNESDSLELAYSIVWTQGALTASGDLEWIANLPLEQRTRLANGTRVLGVHASPGQDDGEGIRPTMSDGQIAAAVEGAEADLIFVGHTHWALDRTVNGVRVINLGGVSLPVLPDLRASYVLLESSDSGYEVTFRKVDYDHQLVIDQLLAQKHPATPMIRDFLEGQRKPFWEK